MQLGWVPRERDVTHGSKERADASTCARARVHDHRCMAGARAERVVVPLARGARPLEECCVCTRVARAQRRERSA
jgi:hypothetical protein